MNAVIEQLTNANFDEVTAAGITLVDFWAPWCGPCKMQEPILDELAASIGNGVRIAKVNVDNEPHLAARFSVSAIPLLILFKDGQEIKRLVGCQTKTDLLATIDKHVNV